MAVRCIQPGAFAVGAWPSAPLRDDGDMLRRFYSPAIRRRVSYVSRLPSLFIHHNRNHHLAIPATSLLDSHHAAPTHPYAFVQALSSAAKSSSLSSGEKIHAAIFKLGFTSNLFVNTALMDMYSKCERLMRARQVFDGMPERNVVAWNILAYGYSVHQRPVLAVSTFAEMIGTGVSPSPSSVSSVLMACSRLEDLALGKMLHCFGLKHGFGEDVVVGTALVDMYSKCYATNAARRMFDEMSERNVITWTSLVNGYALDRRPEDAMVLVNEMRRLGIGLNKVTYNSLLSTFSSRQDLRHGKQVHCLVIREGFDSDPYLVVTLVTMYSKCGSMEDFVNACPSVSTSDQVSCNSVIAGFSHLGNSKEVLEGFLKMRRECMEMDSFTFASVLRAIGLLSSLEEGREIHALIIKSGHAKNAFVENGLVSVYAKCGAINDSKQVFSSMEEPDLVSWNSLISGCAQHGDGLQAVELFEEMITVAVKPDRTTFLSVLTACSHIGLLDKGLKYFNLMTQGDSPVTPAIEHYACIADLLGRAGHLDEAESFIRNVPVKPGVSMYKALLSACQVHNNVAMAQWAADRLFELCPNDSATYVLLSNAFAAGACWDDAAGVRITMHQRGLKKRPAWSWIED